MVCSAFPARSAGRSGWYRAQRYLDGNPCAVYEPRQTGNRVRLQRPDNIITVILRKSKREPVDFLQEMAVFVMKNAHGGRRRKNF